MDQFLAFSPVAQRPSDPKKHEGWAHKVFGLDSNSDAAAIKLRYKELVKSRHPDRMSSKFQSKSLQEVAHDNFTAIQEAYEILQSKSS